MSSGRARPDPEGEPSVQIKIAVRHGTLSDATLQFITDKAEKLLRLFDRLTMIEVTVDLQDGNKSVEFLVQAEHKHDFVARKENDDILTAADGALAKLEKQLRRYKERIMEHRRTPSAGEVAGAPATEEPTEE